MSREKKGCRLTALHTRTSSEAPRARYSAANARTEARLDRSSTAGSAPPPPPPPPPSSPPPSRCKFTSPTAASAFSKLRHAITTWHPARANCLDASKPMPELAPVIRTVRPRPSYSSCIPVFLKYAGEYTSQMPRSGPGRCPNAAAVTALARGWLPGSLEIRRGWLCGTL